MIYTRNGIPLADYKLSVHESAAVLHDYHQFYFPMVPEQIIDAISNEVALITYTSLSRKNGITISEVEGMMDSDLGACAFEPRHGRYIIFYNDTKEYALCRFTIAHELGHIFLNHHHLAGTDVLSRSFIPKQEYKEYEREANAFARNLLSPVSLAYKINEGRVPKAEKISRMMKAFYITKKAATIRIEFIGRDLKNCSEEILHFYSRLKIGNHPFVCLDCHYLLPENAVYCPLCGSKRRIRLRQFKRYPKAIRMDKKHSVRKCIVCGNTKLSPGSNFCRICGSPATNVCTETNHANYSGEPHFNKHYARFCITCGAITVFNQWNMFQSEVDYMHEPVNYNDGVAFDRNSMMVLICPRCGNSEFSSDAMFCRICGADIYNRCEGEIIGSKIIEISRHKNPSNARYCEKCGKPTSFLNEHILCAYTDFVPLEEETGDNFSAAFIADVPQMEENHAVPAETPQPETVQASSFNDVDIDELPF